jgi:hypothetical protein
LRGNKLRGLKNRWYEGFLEKERDGRIDADESQGNEAQSIIGPEVWRLRVEMWNVGGRIVEERKRGEARARDDVLGKKNGRYWGVGTRA